MYFQIFVSIIYNNISEFKSIIGVSVINIRIPDFFIFFDLHKMHENIDH